MMATKDSLKQRGLAESNKEKPMGLFERLRMGNIDQPGSKAYERFGAGRGRREKTLEGIPAARAQLAEDVQNKLKADAAKKRKAAADRSSADIERRQTPATNRVVADKPAAAPATAPIVTKEQMRKAGFDNLRDYLNAQRGLTRRGEKPAAATAPAPASARRRVTSADIRRSQDRARDRVTPSSQPAASPKAKPAEPRKPLAKSEGYQRQIDRDEAAREQRQAAARQRQIESKAAKKESDKASAQRLRDDPKQKELRAAREAREKMSPAQRSAARGQRLKEFFGAPKKMAKGGSVRGSGIARQGVRKAKMM